MDEHCSLRTIKDRATAIAERQAIFEALELFQWNRVKAAKYLDISYRTIFYKIRQYNIQQYNIEHYNNVNTNI